MKIGDYLKAITADLKANAKFLKDVGTHGKVFGLDELKTLTINAPAVRVALVGTRGGSRLLGRTQSADATMGRADNGQFRGPLQMIAFLIEQDWGGEEARDRVIRLADDFMYFLEHRTFGLKTEEAGPALLTGFEVLYSAEIDAQGAAIAAVTWEQEVWFGRDLHAEELAMMTTEPMIIPPPEYTEREWYQKGKLDVTKPPLARSSATGVYTDQTTKETDDHKQMPPIEGE